LVALLVKLTLAFGITACAWSCTDPRTVVLLACGHAAVTDSIKPRNQMDVLSDLTHPMLPPSEITGPLVAIPVD
jgi:hypothetical protein